MRAYRRLGFDFCISLSVCICFAACTKSKTFEVPELEDTALIEQVKKVQMSTLVPAYGIAMFEAKVFEVNIESSDSQKVKLGQSALVYLGGDGKPTPAHVTKLLKNASHETGQSIAWLASDGHVSIPAGEFVFANIRVGQRSAVIVIPQKAIFIRDAKTWVLGSSTNESGKTEPAKPKITSLEVEVGEQSEDQVEIKSGLKPGDQILTEGALGYLYPDFKSQAAD